MTRTCLAVFFLSFTALAQTSPTPSVQASGSATISGIAPDQVQLNVGVVTSAKTAQDAAAQNAQAAQAMIDALKKVLGTSGTVQTISYYLSPQYTTGTTSSPPIISGYTASNTVQVITGNLNLVGPLIDAGNQAGANSISGPSYSLQNSESYQQQALTAATKQALAHAGAIAAGLGGKLGAIISAQEGSTAVPVMGLSAAGGSSTPILTGTVSVSANVTVTVALSQ